MIHRVRANFLTGALIVIPLILTFWVFYFIVDKLNLFLLDPLADIFQKVMPAQNIEIVTKIIVFFLLLALITVVGFAGRLIILRNIFGFGERALYKVPMVSTIYRAIKEISFTFLSQKNTIFQKAVLVEFPRKGVYQIGFVVSQTKGEVQEKTDKTVMNIFIPTTPNPTSGMLVFVPEQDVIYLDMTVAAAMKMVISGGAVVPKLNHGDSKDSSGTYKEKGS